MSNGNGLSLFRCRSLDLEVGVRDKRIHAFAGVRPDTDQSLTGPKGTSLAPALARLDSFADGADFNLGHNLIDFDLPHPKAARVPFPLARIHRWTGMDGVRTAEGVRELQAR